MTDRAELQLSNVLLVIAIALLAAARPARLLDGEPLATLKRPAGDAAGAHA